MYQTFVTGPVGARGFGLARRCIECRARAVRGDSACTGFGVGCLVAPRKEQDARGFSWAPLIDVDLSLRGF